MANPSRRPTRKQFKQYNINGKEDLEEWRDRFVSISDPTEYRAAIDLVGSWADGRGRGGEAARRGFGPDGAHGAPALTGVGGVSPPMPRPALR